MRDPPSGCGRIAGGGILAWGDKAGKAEVEAGEAERRQDQQQHQAPRRTSRPWQPRSLAGEAEGGNGDHPDGADITRDHAAVSLGQIHLRPKVVIPALIEALKNDKVAFVRGAAADALGGFGPMAKDAVPVLIDALQDNDFAQSFARPVVEARGAIGPAAKEALPALRALRKKYPDDDDLLKAIDDAIKAIRSGE
jgi:HEAT repeat protein